MTGSEYQKAAMRTNDGNNKSRLMGSLYIGQDAGIDIAGLIDGCMGLTGEAGEFCDLVKKFVFHMANLNHDHAKKELGDVCWYIAMICHAMGWDLDEILRMNIDKLKARYPEGFDTEKANHRAKGDV